ncbi:hypothetical protein GCK72_013013 [Caenorhabditis remanei]|uniref:ELM2 domain-containing protein n=1 Tax=Caenorhabditis remanei TaxID=31234 RepID=A0A6A5GMI7_CAERE|nr:hypothetical protein GCK72_013013 [Caenorhabditis remanei]KAF1756560.1 hypothetical protein GCK72_013013 [Caenorhabditis remanei]
MLPESPLPSTPMASSPSNRENYCPHSTWNLTPVNTSPSNCSMDSGDVEMEEPKEQETLETPQNDLTPEFSKRKSRRLHKENTSNDNELLANYHNGLGVVERGTKIPIGLGHTPFVFKKKVSGRIQRQNNMLKIDMVPVFRKIESPSISGANRSEKTNSDYLKPGSNKIEIGPNHQADIPQLEESREDEPDREEVIWTPPEQTFDYEICRNGYWRAIWRQFEGQIPFEITLQNLMKCGYSFGESLETVDQNLKTVPQKFKPLCENQYKQFEKLLLVNNFERRTLQEKSMKNYHIAEVQKFYHDFKNAYLGAENTCDSHDPLCKELSFVPRWACSNCTKIDRAPGDLCLICKTYEELTGNTRPATDVVFNDEDAKKIQDWNQLDIKKGRTIPMTEFEKIQEAEVTYRWMNNILTEEEEMMIDNYQLTHRRRWNRLSEAEQKEIGRKIVEQLKPHPLPLFKKCKCDDVENVQIPAPSPVKVVMSQEVVLASFQKIDKDVQNQNEQIKKRKL